MGSEMCIRDRVRSVFKEKQLSFPPRNTEGSQNPRSEWSPRKWVSYTKAKNQNLFFQGKNATSKKKESERTIDAPEHGRSNGIFGWRMNTVQSKECAPGCYGKVGNFEPY